MGSTQEPDWTAVYRASAYAWLDRGRWRAFALDGAGGAAPPPLPESVTLITAWNPGSEERPLPWNEAANARLLRALIRAGQRWAPAFGASLPGTTPPWREEGFAVLGLDRAEACAWGRDWGQRAVVHLTPAGAAELLFCAEETAVACHYRPLPAEEILDPAAVSP
ncbi:MAG: DUF3293 domain-containing protein [Planctomycetota bacterium]|nr:MAG: DUF3293 domain-containing protein [Planctomycetota bacterium]